MCAHALKFIKDYPRWGGELQSDNGMFIYKSEGMARNPPPPDLACVEMLKAATRLILVKLGRLFHLLRQRPRYTFVVFYGNSVLFVHVLRYATHFLVLTKYIPRSNIRGSGPNIEISGTENRYWSSQSIVHTCEDLLQIWNAADPFLDVLVKCHRHSLYRAGSCSDGLRFWCF